MTTRHARTIHNCASEIGFATRGITDNQLRRSIELVAEALEMAYKEIELLKEQLKQKPQETV